MARRQIQWRAKFYHRVLGRALAPDSHFGEGVAERIEWGLDHDELIALSMTHGTLLDPTHIGAAAQREKQLRKLRGKTMIGAKVSLFKLPVVGKIIPDLGAEVVWREKDVKNKRLTPEEQARLLALQKLAGRAFIGNFVQGMDSGLNMAMHVEGTRNLEEPEIPPADGLPSILPVQKGFGRILSSVKPSAKVLIVTTAFDYGQEPDRTQRAPTMYFDIPGNQNRSDPDEVTATITQGLRQSLHEARLIHRGPDYAHTLRAAT